jgi:hypothetical protein
MSECRHEKKLLLKDGSLQCVKCGYIENPPADQRAFNRKLPKMLKQGYEELNQLFKKMKQKENDID